MARILYDTVEEKTYPYPRNDDEDIVGLQAPLVALTIVYTSPPSYDPNTEKLEQFFTPNIPLETYTQGWNVVALSPELSIFDPNPERFNSQLLSELSFNHWLQTLSQQNYSAFLSAFDLLLSARDINVIIQSIQSRYNELKRPKTGDRHRWNAIARQNNININF